MNEQNIKVWILASALAIIGAGFWQLIKSTTSVVTNIVIKRLDEIISELKAINNTTAVHGQEIKNIQEQNLQVTHRLNDHADRIRKIEINHGKTEM